MDGSSSMSSCRQLCLTSTHVGLDKQSSGQSETHSPTTREAPRRQFLVRIRETQTRKQMGCTSGTGFGFHIHQFLLHIAKTRRQLVLFRFPAAFAFRHGLLFQLFQLSIEIGFVGHELVAPDVGLKDGLKGGGVVSHDFLFDVQHRDMRRNGNFTKSEVAKQCRFTHTVTTDKTIVSSTMPIHTHSAFHEPLSMSHPPKSCCWQTTHRY